MKVLLINGSPNEKGCTYTALNYMAKALNERDIETRILHVGGDVLGGCMGCGGCGSTGRCVKDDSVNEALKMAEEADGFVFGSPVHFASPSGDMISFMDRFFYAGNFHHKPAAIVISARRGGTTASFDTLIKYPAYNQMPIVSADYWPIIHGHNSPDEVLKDAEGLFTLDTLARNMAWMLKCIEAGKREGVEPELKSKDVWTNFI